ncbi:src-like-adapter 2 [Leptotrombidium deliense]|uniref:Src-like-adapter 2 n=1 Tax=Leptotrombidium deliense TaxID=299467 RepID=A0A443SMV9_9ACAR|nr:src-like-adapter 2 [Leptotrombidium deliense]
MSILFRRPIGAFVVRVSSSNAGSYALSIRVPNEYRISGVAHYLIVRTPKGTYKIKGFPKEFSCLHSLVVHHSISQELLPCRLNVEDCDKQVPDWFFRSICRDSAMILLDNKPLGAFVVRESTTQQGCFALSLRVPDEYRISGVAHYLIFRSAKGTFQIKGFSKEFPSLQSLIAHYSIMQELLPCPLNLTIACKAKNLDANRAKRSQDTDECEVITSCCDNTDVLVDIDSDADYQRIPSLRRRSPIVKK